MALGRRASSSDDDKDDDNSDITEHGVITTGQKLLSVLCVSSLTESHKSPMSAQGNSRTLLTRSISGKGCKDGQVPCRAGAMQGRWLQTQEAKSSW